MSRGIGLPAPCEPALTAGDLDALHAAVAALERQSFAAQLMTFAGRQINFTTQVIPPRLRAVAVSATQAALSTAARVALRSLDGDPRRDAARLHRGLAALSGGVGGAVGLASLPLELPLSTTIMLRSIAEIARTLYDGYLYEASSQRRSASR